MSNPVEDTSMRVAKGDGSVEYLFVRSGSRVRSSCSPPIDPARALGRALRIFTGILELFTASLRKIEALRSSRGPRRWRPRLSAYLNQRWQRTSAGRLLGSVTCTSTPASPRYRGNPYPDGISYLQTTPATDLHVNLDSDVNVIFSGAQLGAVIVDNRGGNAELTANGAAITANVPGVNGLVATTDNGSGNAIITASGPIQVVGNGIVAIARGDLASVTYNGPGVTSSGSSATVIQAVNTGAGDAFIEARGNSGATLSAPASLMVSVVCSLKAGVMRPSSSQWHNHRGRIFCQWYFRIAGPVGSATVTTDPDTTIIV